MGLSVSPSLGLSDVVNIMGLSEVVTIMGLSDVVTIMELSGDVTTDMGLLDMISKLCITN